MKKEFYLLVISTIIFACQHTDNTKKDTIEYQAIGYFETSNTPAKGAPRQGMLMPEKKGIIKLNQGFKESLNELDEMEYIIVLYHFHLAEGWESIVVPPESHHSFGMFATRTPRRPNPIGFSVIKLDSIHDLNLYVSGVDAFNGTPVLDIKPYLPSVDCPQSRINLEKEEEFGHHDNDFITDTLYKE